MAVGMSETDALLAQMKNCDGFLASQRGVVSDATLESSMKHMAQSIADQVQKMQGLDVANAARLTTGIQATRSFDAIHIGMIATAINQQVTTPKGGKTQVRGVQTIKDVRNYFTAGDWAVFEDEKLTLSQKVSTGADRMMLLGMRNPSEATVKSIAAAIAAAHFPTAPAQQLHALVVDVKMAMHARRNHNTGTGQHLTRYPDNPQNLSQSMWTAAYPNGDPIQKDISGFTVLLNRIPLRTSNRQLNSGSNFTLPTTPLNPVGQLLQQLLQNEMSSQPQSENLLKNLIIHPQRQAPRSHVPALPAPSPQALPLPDDAGSTAPITSGLALHAADTPETQAPGDGIAIAGGQPHIAPVTTDASTSEEKLDGQACTANDLNDLVNMAAKAGAGMAQGKKKGKASVVAKGKAKAKATIVENGKKGTGKGKVPMVVPKI